MAFRGVSLQLICVPACQALMRRWIASPISKPQRVHGVPRSVEAARHISASMMCMYALRKLLWLFSSAAYFYQLFSSQACCLGGLLACTVRKARGSFLECPLKVLGLGGRVLQLFWKFIVFACVALVGSS